MTQADGTERTEGQANPQAQQRPAGMDGLRTDLDASQESLRVLQGQYDQVLAANQQWATWARAVDSRVEALETTPATAGTPSTDSYGYGETPDPVTEQLKHITDRFSREDAEKQRAEALAMSQQYGKQHIADAMEQGGLLDRNGDPDNSLIDWGFMNEFPATPEGANQATMAALKVVARKSGELRQKRNNAEGVEQKQIQVDGAERQRQLEAAAARDNGATAAQVGATPGTPAQNKADLYIELVQEGQFAEAAKLRKQIDKDLRHGVTVPHPTPMG